jgi:uncharacterized protein YjbJ (UPF0337 family)
MSAGDKAKDKMQTAKGKTKETAGRAINDPVLKGKGDKVAGNLKQAGEKTKGAFRKYRRVGLYAGPGPPSSAAALQRRRNKVCYRIDTARVFADLAASSR